MSNEVEKVSQQELTVQSNAKSLMAAQQKYLQSISAGMESIIGAMSSYQSICGYNILNSISTLLAKEGLTFTDKAVDKESINNAIMYCVIYGLNTDNREVFPIVRKEKRPILDKYGNPEKNEKGYEKYYYVRKVEVKPQYKGTIKILSKYGRNVKKVYPEWIVREGDEFTYATYKGVDILPPTWTPKSYNGKVLRVVVPVEYDDGFIDYRIAERESVALNIKAQIKQSLMGAWKDEEKERAARINELVKDMTLEQLLECKESQDLINATYTGLSREEMIITKLVLNATKRVGIDYEKALPQHANVARELDEKTYDNADVYVKNHTAKDLIEQQQTPVEIETNDIEEITTEEVGEKKSHEESIAADDNGVVEVKEEQKERTIDDLFKENDDDRLF